MQIYVLLMSLISICSGARILGVIPSPGYSQYLLGNTLMNALAARGHQVLVISPFYQNNNITNYEEIIVRRIMHGYKDKNLFEFDSSSPYSSIMRLYGEMSLHYTEEILKDAQVQKLLNTHVHFDLVICEQFFNEAHMGFAYHFKAPLILLSTMGPSEFTNHLVGNPSALSVYPSIFSSHSDTMNFQERLRNTMYGTFEFVYKHLVALPKQNIILKTYFPNAPKLSNLIYNASLVLLNSNVGVYPVSPLLPNMVDIGGFHISPKPLPDDLQTFLDGAADGAIYFSMGTNLNAEKVSDRISKDILQCFSTLKQRVIWKWKDITDAPKNVRIGQWFPQQDILAHRNLRLFVTHSGLISIIESIHYGVPIIGIPIFGDQKMNMAVAVSRGYGIKIPFKSLSGRTICTAINEMLTNNTVEALKRSQVMQDQPMKPLEKAIFWIEYVLRHKGAPYLRSSSLNLSWIQYYLLDVVACMILILCVSVLVSILLLKLLFAKKKRRKHVKKD